MSLVTVVVLGLLIYFTPVGWFVIIPARIYLAKRENLGEYERHRANYDAAVQTLAAKVTDPARRYEFFISRDRMPGSLKDGEANQDNYAHATFVRAWPDEKGMVVTFLTKDLGHLGSCWLYHFHSGSPTPRTFLSGEQAVQVGPGWYAVYDPRG